MRRTLLIGVAAVGLVAGLVTWWRRHPRTGAAWVNQVLDPWLVRQGVVGSSNGEIGLLEHIGRKSGLVRVTPVHPVRTQAGFQIVVPLGVESQWALNVLAAGHCRLQVGDVVHELDEPLLVAPSDVEGLPELATQAMDWLGFRYLVLRQFADYPGSLENPTPTQPEAEATPVSAAESAPPEALAAI
jgi:deazaflavin-dependent oxidoreductase (nitroreductase family)